MEEVLKKTLQTGLGLAFLTKEKAEELVDELKEGQGEHIESGKELAREMLVEGKKQQKKLESFVQKQIKTSLSKAGIVTKQDLKKLHKRLDKLEKKSSARKSKA